MSTNPVLPIYLAIDGQASVTNALINDTLERVRAIGLRGVPSTRLMRLGVVELSVEQHQRQSIVHLKDQSPVHMEASSMLRTDFGDGFKYVGELIAHDVDFFKANAVTVGRPLVMALLGSGFSESEAERAAVELADAKYSPNVMAYGMPGVPSGALAGIGSTGAFSATDHQPQSTALDHVASVVQATSDRFASGRHSVALPLDHPGLESVGGRVGPA